MPPISRSGGGGGKSDSLHWPAGPWSLPRSSVFKPVANTQKKKKTLEQPFAATRDLFLLDSYGRSRLRNCFVPASMHHLMFQIRPGLLSGE